MQLLGTVLWCFLAFSIKTTIANTEKVIFKAPPISDLYMDKSTLPILASALSSRIGRLVYELETTFANTSASTELTEQWFDVRGLRPGWLYEIRICWPAVVSSTTPNLNSE